MADEVETLPSLVEYARSGGRLTTTRNRIRWLSRVAGIVNVCVIESPIPLSPENAAAVPDALAFIKEYRYHGHGKLSAILVDGNEGITEDSAWFETECLLRAVVTGIATEPRREATAVSLEDTVAWRCDELFMHRRGGIFADATRIDDELDRLEDDITRLVMRHNYGGAAINNYQRCLVSWGCAAARYRAMAAEEAAALTLTSIPVNQHIDESKWRDWLIATYRDLHSNQFVASLQTLHRRREIAPHAAGAAIGFTDAAKTQARYPDTVTAAIGDLDFADLLAVPMGGRVGSIGLLRENLVLLLLRAALADRNVELPVHLIMYTMRSTIKAASTYAPHFHLKERPAGWTVLRPDGKEYGTTDIDTAVRYWYSQQFQDTDPLRLIA